MYLNKRTGTIGELKIGFVSDFIIFIEEDRIELDFIKKARDVVSQYFMVDGLTQITSCRCRPQSILWELILLLGLLLTTEPIFGYPGWYRCKLLHFLKKAGYQIDVDGTKNVTVYYPDIYVSDESDASVHFSKKHEELSGMDRKKMNFYLSWLPMRVVILVLKNSLVAFLLRMFTLILSMLLLILGNFLL